MSHVAHRASRIVSILLFVLCSLFSFSAIAQAQGATSTTSTSSGSGSGLPTTEERPFQPIVPQLGVDIPGVVFTPASEAGGIVSIPYLAQYVNGVYRYLVAIVLIVSIVMVVYGGFRYLVGASMGDIQTGKKIIVDALAGMLITLGAYMILNTVNPATVNLSTLKLTNIVGLTDFELESLEADFGDSIAAPSGAPGEFITIDTTRMVRVDETCIHTNTPVDPSLAGPLRDAATRFCGLRGTHTNWRILGGGFRSPALSLRLWLKRCVNRVNCTVGTGAPLRPGVVTRDSAGRWSFADAGLRALIPAGPAPATAYSDEAIESLYQRLLPQAGALSTSGHARGLAVDLYCGGATTNQADAYVPCQLLLEQAMKEAGFCRLPNEWWHFELASNHPSPRCSSSWNIGTVEVRVGDATTPTIFNYGSCTGRYSITRAQRGEEACH